MTHDDDGYQHTRKPRARLPPPLARAPGPQELRTALASRMITQAQLAHALDVSQLTVSAWCRGTHSPHVRYLADLEALTGVSLVAWIPPPSKRWYWSGSHLVELTRTADDKK